jgi:hypothetical protein
VKNIVYTRKMHGENRIKFVSTSFQSLSCLPIYLCHSLCCVKVISVYGKFLVRLAFMQTNNQRLHLPNSKDDSQSLSKSFNFIHSCLYSFTNLKNFSENIYLAIWVLLDIPDRRVLNNPAPLRHHSAEQYCCSSAVTGAVLNRMLQGRRRCLALGEGDGDGGHSWSWNFNYNNRMRQEMTRKAERMWWKWRIKHERTRELI